MSAAEPPTNSLSWRVTVLERDVEKLKAAEPAVVSERVSRLLEAMRELKAEIASDMAALQKAMEKGDETQSKQIKDFRRIFVGVFSALGVTVAASVIALIITGGTP